jgi:hypothetical protein
MSPILFTILICSLFSMAKSNEKAFVSILLSDDFALAARVMG